MKRLARGLLKPCYVFAPGVLAARVAAHFFPPRVRTLEVRLAWGAKLGVDLADAVGREIFHQRVFDLAVSELAWRMLRPGDRAVDVGAHIGYLTCLCATRVGERGEVHAFEPHPETFRLLAANIARWGRLGAVVRPHQLAVGAATGAATVMEPPSFWVNRGTARVAPVEGSGPGAGAPVVRVAVEMLDRLWPEGRIDLLKVDVEGAELAVLQGAERLLAERRIGLLIYEDNTGPDSGIAGFLERFGYRVWSAGYDFFGPVVRPADRPAPLDEGWQSRNYVAATDAAALREIVAPRGWRVLRGRR